jgi:hypothetical protein
MIQMYNLKQYKNIASNYGSYGSWAIWDYKNAKDTLVIDQNFEQLNSKFVFLGLNISRSINDRSWLNFHDNTHARKLKYACNNTILRGSYMTDIFKDLPEPNSNKIDSILTQELINKNVELFKKEMKDIGISDETIFIIFGKKAFEKFNKHFKNKLKNKIIYHRHYSSRGTDREWVEGFWEKFNIKSDYNTTVNKYGK